MYRAIDLIDKFTDRIGRTIAWLTPGMVVLVVVIVILRYAFQFGSIALKLGRQLFRGRFADQGKLTQTYDLHPLGNLAVTDDVNIGEKLRQKARQGTPEVGWRQDDGLRVP